MYYRLDHRVVRSSQATPAAVDKSQRLEHENSDSPVAPFKIGRQVYFFLRSVGIFSSNGSTL